MVLINWKTPHKELVKTVGEELPKALRWLSKKTSDLKTHKQLAELALQANTSGKEVCLPTPIEYTSSNGNHWLLLKTVDWDKRLYDAAVVYGLTGKYMWAVAPMCFEGIWMSDADHKLMVYTPHFFQRFYERLNIEQKDRKLALRNFIMISRKMPVRLLSENIHNSKVLARLKGCVCYGHTQGEAIYINTVLPETHLCENKVNSTRGFRTMSDSSVNTYYGIISRALLEERPVSWVKKTVKSFALSKESIRMITTELGLRLMFTRAMFEYRRRAGEMIDYDLGKVKDLVEDALADLCGSKPLTYDNIYPWVVSIMRATTKDINPLLLAETMKELKEIGGEGNVDFDKFHYLGKILRDEMRKELKL